MSGELPATVMIVDDEPENLRLLENILGHDGYRVVAFPQGKLALDAAREHPPDLALVDIRMPNMNGYQLCEAFKSDDTLAEVPLIFVSALAATEDITKGFKAGAVDYVTKPARAPELLARVHTHLDLRKSYADLAESHKNLQRLERARDNLVHMLVHDLRTPLQGCLGHLDYLSDYSGSLGPAELQEHLEGAINRLLLINEHLRRMIDISRLESQQMPVHTDIVDLAELIHRAVEDSFGPEEQQRIQVDLPELPIDLVCDSNLTERILANLLTNALKYSEPGEDVVVSAEPGQDDNFRILVRDKGPGIADVHQAHIFDKFWVAERQGEEHIPATGIGLAFCKLAVDAQGGTIGVDSKLDHGSTFWFTVACSTTRREAVE
ncbi:MAG: response regulator [Candidatus Pacebacteria bacterium]|nr:response regulator [Candidatus Paceibacterota bacterium]